MILQQILRDPSTCPDGHVLKLNALTLTWFCARCLDDVVVDEGMPS